MWAGMVRAAVGQLSAGPLERRRRGLPAASRSPSRCSAPAGSRAVRGPVLGAAGAARAQLPGPRAGSAAAVAPALAARWAAGRAEPRARASPRSGARPIRWRGSALVAAPGGAGLAALLALSPPAPPEKLTVSFLDVGQGDATLIQDPSGPAVLFDGGPPEARVARQLRNAGVRRLALVVATHQSADHHGGLERWSSASRSGPCSRMARAPATPPSARVLVAARRAACGS